MAESRDLNQKELGIISEIERYALNDGPGIRTVIFFKGCPLRCLWCANPETQKRESQLMYFQKKCIGCGSCIEACPHEVLTMGENGIEIRRECCTKCGDCTEVCYAEALTMVGEKMSVEEVMEELMKDEHFYLESDGGVTFSGGESLAQLSFLLDLARRIKNENIHICIETSGYLEWEKLEQLVPYIDLFLYDFKQMDEDKHRNYTGVSNKIIHENFKKLMKLDQEVVARFPVIPGYNDENDNLEKMASFLSEYISDIRIDLLPYHSLGEDKYYRLDCDYKVKEVEPPSSERMGEIKSFFNKLGFNTRIEK